MNSKRFDRNNRFFGKEGQQRLSSTKVAIVGIGGLGTHVVQQLALLGVGNLSLIDPEELDDTNFNRYIGVQYNDPVPGTLKVEVGERIVKQINPEITVAKTPKSLISQEAFGTIIASDYIFGCIDRDGLRLILNELCNAYSKPYFDLSSDIILRNNQYGGRLCTTWQGCGCIVCLNELDVVEARADLMNAAETRDRRTIYGVPRNHLGAVGPSVVSINGVVASLGVTEFMLLVTGLRSSPRRLLTYHADRGTVNCSIDEPSPDCYYCKGIYGKGDDANVQRYLQAGIQL